MSLPGKLAALTLPLAWITTGCGGLPAPLWVRPASELPPVADWRPLVGCYRPIAPPSRRASAWTYPSFGLDSVPALTYWNPPPEGALQAWRYAADYHGDLYWSITPDGWVTLVTHNGMDGGTTRYRVHADTLVGLEDGWSDIVGPERAPGHVLAVREPCPGAASQPPPNPEQLSLTFTRGLADVLRDSVLPRYRGAHLLQIPRDAPRTGAIVSSILGVASQGDTATTYGLRLEVEDAVARDRATATVTLSVCEPRVEPQNLRVERIHYEFVRAPGAWRLVSSTSLPRTTGHCGAAATPPSP
jgi:hypothetical protein